MQRRKPACPVCDERSELSYKCSSCGKLFDDDGSTDQRQQLRPDGGTELVRRETITRCSCGQVRIGGDCVCTDSNDANHPEPEGCPLCPKPLSQGAVIEIGGREVHRQCFRRGLDIDHPFSRRGQR